MDRILDLYKNMNAPINEVDITSLQDVDTDNVCYKLNQTFGGFFSFDTEIITGAMHLLKATLYTPIKVSTGYVKIDMNKYDMNELTRAALVQAVELGFDFRTQGIVPTDIAPAKDVAATTLEDLEEIEKEIAASIEHEDNEIKVENLGPVEFKQDPPNTTGNKFGIREDQIEFMKKFQDTFHIDTAEKFDDYVHAWASTQSMYAIQNKKQLIGCGPDAVDAFINWVKEVNKENVQEQDFVVPSDKEWDECCE